MGILFVVLSILANMFMFATFKEIEHRNLSARSVIFVNYLVCSALGIGLEHEFFFNPSSWDPFFIGLSVLTGLLFVSNFLLMNVTSRFSGLGFTAVVAKMSLVIPVTLSALWFGEKFNLLTGTGIVLALAAIFLVNYRERNQGSPNLKGLIFGVILFITTGATDSIFKVENQAFPTVAKTQYALMVFFAATIAISVLMGHDKIKGKASLTLKDALAGLILGTANFAALVFFTTALDYFDGPTLFPLNHIGILVMVNGLALLLYREKFNKFNFIGIAAAVVAIILLLWPD